MRLNFQLASQVIYCGYSSPRILDVGVCLREEGSICSRERGPVDQFDKLPSYCIGKPRKAKYDDRDGRTLRVTDIRGCVYKFN